MSKNSSGSQIDMSQHPAGDFYGAYTHARNYRRFKTWASENGRHDRSTRAEMTRLKILRDHALHLLMHSRSKRHLSINLAIMSSSRFRDVRGARYHLSKIREAA